MAWSEYVIAESPNKENQLSIIFSDCPEPKWELCVMFHYFASMSFTMYDNEARELYHILKQRFEDEEGETP